MRLIIKLKGENGVAKIVNSRTFMRKYKSKNTKIADSKTKLYDWN